jgi:hypothetical protein
MAAACGSTQPTESPLATQPSTSKPTTASSAAPSPTPTPAHTPAPTASAAVATLLLEITQEGGFIAPSAHLGQLPQIEVDTEGNIYTPDPNQASQLLIPHVVVRDVGAEGARRILTAMKAAGLDTQTSTGVAGDAGVTVFTAEIDGQEVVTRIAQEGPPGPGHPGASPQPAIDLLNRLLDPTQTWGAGTVANVSYDPTAYRVYVVRTVTDGTARSWPLATPIDQFGRPSVPDFGESGLRVGIVTGDDAVKIAQAFGNAGPESYVQDEQGLSQIWITPLLPPEIS